MKIFMLGWEFPPFISGDLGTACYGLTKAMSQLGLKVTFCLPKMVDSQYATHVNLLLPPDKTCTPSQTLCDQREQSLHILSYPRQTNLSTQYSLDRADVS